MSSSLLPTLSPQRHGPLESVEARATPHETGIWPHFKAFSKSESWKKLSRMKEESCLTLFLPAGQREENHLASGPGTPPFSLTSASLPTKKDDGGLLLPSTSHGLSPGSKALVGCCVCVGGGLTRGTAPQTTTPKCEMWHKKDGFRERVADGDWRGVRLRIMHVSRDRQGLRYGGKDKEDRDKWAGLYYVPSLPTQRPTEEAMHHPEVFPW